MIELQFDADGRRCVEHIKPKGKKTSFDGAVPESGELPDLKVNPSKVTQILLVANGGANVQIGEDKFRLEAGDPFLQSGPISQADEVFEVTAQTDEPSVNLTVVVYQK